MTGALRPAVTTRPAATEFLSGVEWAGLGVSLVRQMTDSVVYERRAQ